MFRKKTAGNKLSANHPGGKYVRMSDAHRTVYESLVKEASRDHSWAIVAVNGLNTLAKGRIDINALYIDSTSTSKEGYKLYRMVFPGVRATVEKQEDNYFHITELEADFNYSELQQRRQKPGLYKASRNGQEWDVKFVKDGKLPKERSSTIAIASLKYKSSNDLTDIAEAIAKKINNCERVGRIPTTFYLLGTSINSFF
ncbi:hypothetical protein [Marinibactrum halimedae]|uniref:Uncharacterized protein n=1 Tax=Marinibactrum halimedae TaxID=1444977 RepID=A0AA37TBM9_9GAMM|nr:hypothetical protein [Marinibactrum halimedae]MCD9458198.1 hypothetical protein [Marinibactrum halimedae]GLS27175.1 hypothetical protein GCM10007877_28940 [Marinibactrum halimedae]